MKTAVKAVRTAIHFGREMRLKMTKTGDAMGHRGWRSSILGDPGANFLYGKQKLTKFREHLSKSR